MHVNFARLLCEHGYAVMRFDYKGYGDSEGLFEEATIDSMTDDTNNAIQFLHEKVRIEKFCLLGARLGGTIAALVAQKNLNIKGLVLWDPIIDGYPYIYRCLRTNLAMQTLRHKKVLFNRDKLIEMILAGELVNIDGYLIGSGLYCSIKDINIKDQIHELPEKLLIARVAEKELPEGNDLLEFVGRLKEAGKDVVVVEAKDAFSWESQRYYRPKPTQIFEPSLIWVLANFD